MLTKAECKVVADCARNYPPGHGSRLFYDDGKTAWTMDAAERLQRDPSALRFG